MVAIFVRSPVILPLATTLPYFPVTANPTGIIPFSGHVPFVAPSQTTVALLRSTRSFARRRNVPILLNDSHLLSLRGGDLDESDDGRENSEVLETLDRDKIRVKSIDVNESNLLDRQVIKPRSAEIDNAKNNGISCHHDAWEEEIHRLQMYLSSPQSKMPHTRTSNLHNVQPVENAHAYGTGEEVGVLGSTLTTQDRKDAGDENLAFTPSFDDTQSDASSTSSVPSSKYDEDEDTFADAEVPAATFHGDDSQIREIYENHSMLTFGENETQNVRSDGNVGDAPNATEVDVDVPDAFDRHRDEIHVDSADGENIPTDADEGHEEGTIRDTLDTTAAQTGLDSSGADTTNESTSHFGTLTDTEEYIDGAYDELERDGSEVTDSSWESAPPVADSNKLVEEGLRKLRRKNGDEPSVPYAITRAMKRVLVDELGYDEQEVQSMRPDVAVVVVSENLQRPSISTLPSRFYNEDIMPLTKNELPHRVGLRQKIRAFIEWLDFKQCTIMLGSILTVSYSLVSKVNRNDDEKRTKKHENGEKIHQNISSENIAENESFDSSNEALLQSDLDRTWLERLISMLTFYK